MVQCILYNKTIERKPSKGKLIYKFLRRKCYEEEICEDDVSHNIA